MKKNLLFTLVAVCALTFAHAQTEKNWKAVENNTLVRKAISTTRSSFPTDFQLFELNSQTLIQSLNSAPSRLSGAKKGVIITIPNVSGTTERFEVFEFSNFDSTLQAQFPEIRSYSGVGVDDKNATVRFSVAPNGVQSMIFRADKRNEFMEPYSQDGKIYAVFNSAKTKDNLGFTCYTDDVPLKTSLNNAVNSSNQNKSNTGQLKTMRLAMSCTSEYSAYFGATSSAQVGLVLAGMNATMTRCNGVFEKDLGLHLNIIAQSTNVIFYNAATDPYSDPAAGSGGAWNTELQNTLSSTLTGVGTTLAANNAVYDIGHLFGASGGGGNAGCIGCVCVDDTASAIDKNKGSGFTSPGDGVPQGDNFDIDYVAHEMGHQFGGNHTFSHTTENNPVNVEPGSGSTIMGYAGITGATDVQGHSDDYYVYASILQIQSNLATKTCPVTTTLSNLPPVMNSGGNFTIPKGTPFKLTGSGVDPNGDTINYCWEENDDATTNVGAANSYPSGTKTNGPNFRSFKPVSVPFRYFPKIETVLANQLSNTWEATSTGARTLNFVLTGRDNVAGAGQTGHATATITVSNLIGPFDVTSQTADGVTFTPGTTQTVTWTVNSTTSLVGSTNVDILLSTDGGLTFPTALASNTPNDGTEVITIPNVSAPYCRIMVKPTGNVYYDINPKAFAIGNYTYQPQNVCTDYPFTLNAGITESSDNSYPGTSLNIPDSFTISDANFYANVTHPSIGQFSLLIKAPFQTALNTALWYSPPATPSTCTNANMDKWFDTAGTAQTCSTTSGGPFLPFSVANINGYNGQNSAGAWLIYFKDTVVDGNNVSASFNSFTIQLCSSQMVPVLASATFELQNLAIYPNPNKGNFKIQFDEAADKTDILVHDLSGRLIYKNEYQSSGLFNETVQLNNPQTGIYLVTIKSGNNKTVKKIVVE